MRALNIPRHLRIAHRIHRLLLRELGQGIDAQRMVAEPLYARDVLLVCDAHAGSDLASLAQHFRSALTDPRDEQGQPSHWGADSAGFGAPRTLPGDSTLRPAVQAPRKRWLSPSRWLGR